MSVLRAVLCTVANGQTHLTVMMTDLAWPVLAD